MEKLKCLQNNNRIQLAEKGFFFLFTLYAALSSCGFTFGTLAITVVMWPSFLLGVFLIAYRALHYQNYISTPFFFFTVAMLVSIAISTLLNYQYSFKSNVIFCVYWALYFLVLYITEKDASVEKIKKDFHFIAAVFTVFISLLVLASFAVFFIGYGKTVALEEGFTYYIGFAIGRLWGVFVNLNRGAVSAAIAAFLLLYFCKTKKKVGFRILAGIMVFLDLMFIALSDSRSGAICFAVLAGAFAFLTLSARFRDQKIGKRLLAILLAMVVMVTGYLLPRIMKKLYNQTAKIIYQIALDSSKENEEEEPEEPEEVDRGYDLSDDISNKRFDVWGSGIEIYSDSLKNMMIGTSFGGMLEYAENHLPDTYILAVEKNKVGKIGTMDNDFLNLLVGQGIVGTVVVMSFAVGVFLLFIKKVKQVGKEEATEVFVMLSVIMAITVTSMVTSLIFYYFSQNSILFWAFLGLTVRLLTCGKGE